MPPVTYFVGGSVGSDPLAPNTWSGSSASLVRALGHAGLLDKAVGVELASYKKILLLAKNFTRDRAVWRRHFYFDPAYRQALTQAAGKIAVASPVCLQIGAMFNLPEVFRDKKCISYHDGSLPELERSGFGPKGVSAKRIEQALRYEEQSAQSMTAVFTFSEYLRQSFIYDYRMPAKRVFNVGGAINLTEVPAANGSKDYSKPKLLFIGREFERKGGPQLLKAFAILRESVPKAELHIAGPTHLESPPEGVRFHGHLSKADPVQHGHLERLFEEASLFVLPSLYEPFGIAPLEAMLYRLPCLVTNAWALRETVTPGVNGDLVEKGNVEELAAKMKALLTDPAKLATMGATGRQMVLERYTWAAVVERMSLAIDSLG